MAQAPVTRNGQMRDESREELERLYGGVTGTIASSRAADQAHHCDIVHLVRLSATSLHQPL